MKSTYQKPMLAMETFSLTQDTSRDCADTYADRTNLSDISTCKWDLGGGFTVFTSNNCTLDGVNMEYSCYNNPAEGQYIFHS